MRIRSNLIMAAILATMLAGSAFVMPAAAQQEPAVAAEPEISEIDRLFTELRAEANTGKARRVARGIWQIWTDSGSDTIDLLMEWALQKIQQKQYVLADELLTQIVVLKPDYVEGWNRRATLHYITADYSRSLADIRQVLRMEPRHFGALAGLASILQRTDQDRKALETWYNVLALYPANRQAQEAVIKLEEELAGRGT